VSAEPIDAAIAEIESALAGSAVTFVRLPAVDLAAADRLTTLFESFQTHDVPAGTDAKTWLCDRAIAEYTTARTTLAIADGRLEGFYSLAAQHVDLTEPERAAAGVAAERRRVPATLMAWIARDPHASVTGRQLLLHALAISRQASELAASAVMVLDAHNDTTAEMWLSRSYGLRRSERQPLRLWVPLQES
jgi:hypothetical protein